MHSCLQYPCGRRLHRSSGPQKAQAIRMTPRGLHQKLKWSKAYSNLRCPLAQKLLDFKSLPAYNSAISPSFPCDAASPRKISTESRVDMF